MYLSFLGNFLLAIGVMLCLGLVMQDCKNMTDVL
jgi:hypothetical protein